MHTFAVMGGDASRLTVLPVSAAATEADAAKAYTRESETAAVRAACLVSAAAWRLLFGCFCCPWLLLLPLTAAAS